MEVGEPSERYASYVVHFFTTAPLCGDFPPLLKPNPFQDLCANFCPFIQFLLYGFTVYFHPRAISENRSVDARAQAHGPTSQATDNSAQ